MSRIFSRLLFIIFSILIFTTANAGTTIIVTTPPPVREVVMPPGGYSACYKVAGRFHHGYWIPAHRVCEYGNGGIWVSGYWRCVRFQPYDGVCRGWGWMPGHWAMANEFEYQRPWRVAYAEPVYRPAPYAPVYYHHGYDHHRWYH